MDKLVSAAEAKRRFSDTLRTVKNGQSVIVTSHGKPVAKIVLVHENDSTATRARAALFGRLKNERAVKAVRYTRDELYD